MFSRINKLVFIILVLICPLLSSGQGPAYTVYPHVPGISLSSVRHTDIGFDSYNQPWVAMLNFGVAVYDSVNNNWTVLNSQNGLPSDSVNTLEFAGGEVWIGTNAGAVRYAGNPLQGGSIVSVYTTPQLPASIVTAIMVDGGFVWFGTLEGLARVDLSNNQWSYYPLSNDSITKIIRDGSGNLWVGTRNGLFMTQNNGITWANFTPAGTNNILGSYIFDLEFDVYNRVFVSSGTPVNYGINCSVSYYYNGVFKKFLMEDFEYGYVSGSITVNSLNFAKDQSGHLLFTNTGAGLNYGMILRIGFCDLHFFMLDDILSGLSCNASSAFGFILRVMPNGNLWRSTRFRSCHTSFPYQSYLTNITEMVMPPMPQTSGCNDCAEGPFGNSEFDLNLVRTTILSGGGMHWDLADAKYEVPKGSGKHAIFCSSHWIGGIDDGGLLRMAAQRYRFGGNDFWPGPLDGMSMAPGANTAKYFDKVYKVGRWEIESFKDHFQNGTISYQPCNNNVPISIIEWPAKGNGIITGDLAPFVDVDGNGVYNPLTGGDYPLIKGDQMLFKVYNDSLNTHTETGGLTLGFEFRTSVYGYLCDTISPSQKVINYTTLYHTEVINRSNRNYTNMYIGLYTDVYLGNPIDNFVGCDIGRNAGYGYNGDADDDGFNGYGTNPPIINAKVLRGPPAVPGDGIDNNNNGVIDETGERCGMNGFNICLKNMTAWAGNPIFPLDYYNYMRGVWRNGEPITYGGIGHNSGSTDTTYFHFSGSTHPVYYPTQGLWTEYTAGRFPEDRVFVLGTGPFNLNAGDTVTIDYAYIFSRDSLSGGNVNLSLNEANLDLVQSWFDNNNFPGCVDYNVGVSNIHEDNINIEIYPNPTSGIIYISIPNGNHLDFSYKVFNLLGEKIIEGPLTTNTINLSSLSRQIYILELYSIGFKKQVKIVRI